MRQSILFQLLRNNKPISVHNTLTEAINAKNQKYEKEMENIQNYEHILSDEYLSEPEKLDNYTIKPIKLNN